jgi:hypothetical protein
MVEETEELVLAPDFQRNSVWKTEQKHELIESLLMGIPIPVIYVFENEQGVKQMVDGRQRVGTIIDFMNGKFALNRLGLLHQFNNQEMRNALYCGESTRLLQELSQLPSFLQATGGRCGSALQAIAG